MRCSVFICLLSLGSFYLNAQRKVVSFGVGLNTTIHYQPPYSLNPNLPASPYLTLRVNKNEFLAGVDLYSSNQFKTVISGGQAGYRYHFLKEHKKNNLMVEFNSQYVQYMDGCGSPVPYYTEKYACFDATTYKCKSSINTVGIGAELFFSKRLYFYSLVGGGVQYKESKINTNLSEFPVRNSTYIQPLAYVRVGLCYHFVVRKKNHCDSCPS